MSFLYKRAVRFLDNLTKDPVGEAADKALNAAIAKANSKIEEERSILKKAQSTPFSLGQNNGQLNYSVMPHDAKDIETLLDTASETVKNESRDVDVEDYMKQTFNDKYEQFKKNAYYNNSIYPTGNLNRLLGWFIFRTIKQTINDNATLSGDEKSLLTTLSDDCKKILEETKSIDYSNTKGIETVQQIVKSDTKNILDLLGVHGSLSNDTQLSPEATNLLKKEMPRYVAAWQKISKNSFEVDFNDKEADTFTGIISSSSIREQAHIEDKSQDEFSVWKLIGKTLSYAITVFICLIVLFLLSLGSSLAVNANVHKPFGYKLFYMFYGFIFGPVVLIYTLFYHWWWRGIRPVYYGYIPLLPRFFVNPTVQFLLGWMTYKPDSSIIKLEEWRHPTVIPPHFGINK